jgi:uncharacterized RDD family membrane protein YckC
VSNPPPPSEDDLEATVAMPRVTPPPPPHPTVRRIDPVVVEPREPVRVSPAAPPPPWPAGGPGAPPRQAAPPRPAAVHERAPYDFGHPVGYVLARLFAFVLDAGLVSVVVTSLFYSLIAINPITGLPTNTQRGFDATLALGIAVALVYVWVAEALFGTTIGKLALGLHVYAVRGGAVGLGRALVRNLLRPLDSLVVGGLLALLPGHRRVGDLAGGTVVARSTMRGFGPVIGWVLALILAGVPFVLAGVPRTFASLMAFYQFFPGIVARVVLVVHHLFGALHINF